jgi:hypothetical protein
MLNLIIFFIWFHFLRKKVQKLKIYLKLEIKVNILMDLPQEKLLSLLIHSANLKINRKIVLKVIIIK